MNVFKLGSLRLALWGNSLSLCSLWKACLAERRSQSCGACRSPKSSRWYPQCQAGTCPSLCATQRQSERLAWIHPGRGLLGRLSRLEAAAGHRGQIRACLWPQLAHVDWSPHLPLCLSGNGAFALFSVKKKATKPYCLNSNKASHSGHVAQYCLPETNPVQLAKGKKPSRLCLPLSPFQLLEREGRKTAREQRNAMSSWHQDAGQVPSPEPAFFPGST